MKSAPSSLSMLIILSMLATQFSTSPIRVYAETGQVPEESESNASAAETDDMPAENEEHTDVHNTHDLVTNNTMPATDETSTHETHDTVTPDGEAGDTERPNTNTQEGDEGIEASAESQELPSEHEADGQTAPDVDNEMNAETIADTASNIEATSTIDTFFRATSTAGDSALVPASTTERASSTQSTIDDNASTTQIEAAPISTATSTGHTEIVSGSAVAIANILNLVNSNFVNSHGVVLFSNLLEAFFGTLDFRKLLNGTSTCSLSNCEHEDVSVRFQNTASILNALVVQAISGRNTIEAEGGDATIHTGDAYAGANVINVANTNLIDSNYVLVTLNAFDDVHGDIVFPSLSQFFSTLAESASPGSIALSSNGVVMNDVDTTAGSGGNTVVDTAQTSIETGHSYSSTNVFNELNASLIGGQSVSVIFRVHGAWVGEIFGAPENLGWIEGNDGSIYLFDTGTGNGTVSAASVEGTNGATIHNDVQVVALTGENHIGGADTALIATGNAHAGANIINVVNSTVVGRNWILAIINIFGDFNGNIAFGRPDLWVGEQIDVPDDIENGSELTYRITIMNNGDSPASAVRLTDEYDSAHIEILEASVPFIVDGESLVFELGALPPGSATEVSYRARIQSAEPHTDITNVVTVTSKETDNNLDDNTDTATVQTDPAESGSHTFRHTQKTAEEVHPIEPVTLTTSRVLPASTLDARTRTSDQLVIIENASNETARNVVLHDILKTPDGVVLEDELWELGDVQPGEHIQIGYTITFSENAVAGTYTLTTTISGDNVSARSDTNGSISVPALTPEADPEVAGVSSSTFALMDRPSPLRPEAPESPRVPLIATAFAAEGADSTDQTGPNYIAPLSIMGGALLLILLALLRRKQLHDDGI